MPIALVMAVVVVAAAVAVHQDTGDMEQVVAAGVGTLGK